MNLDFSFQAETKMSGDGRLEKMEVDYSTTCDEKIPECETLAKVSLQGP